MAKMRSMIVLLSLFITYTDGACQKNSALYVPGSDGMTTSTFSNCKQMCESRSGCLFFTWNTNNRGCGLRSYSFTSFVTAPTQVTGFPFSSVELHNVVPVGKVSRQTSSTACKNLCLNDYMCTTWSFFNSAYSQNPNQCVLNRFQSEIQIPGPSTVVSGKKTCDTVMLFGGIYFGHYSSSAVIRLGTCNVGTNSLPSQTTYPRASILGNKIYVCGGWTSGASSACSIRDLTGNGQSTGPNMVKRRAYFTLNTVGDKLVAVGGRDESNFHNTFEVLAPYTSSNPQWKLQTLTISPARDNLCGVTISSTSIMLLGGYNPSTGDLKTVEKLDIARGTLYKYANLPQSLVFFACALFQNKIYTSGGFISDNPDITTNRVFYLDLSNPYWWYEGPPMKRIRTSHAMAVVDGALTVYSGDQEGAYYMETLVDGKWKEEFFSSFRRYGSASVTVQC